MDARLELQLTYLAERARRLSLNLGLSFCWLAAAVVAGLSILLARGAGWDGRLLAVITAVASLVAGCCIYAFTRTRSRNLLDAARRIERQFPSLDHRLLAAIEPRSIKPSAPIGYLQQRVVKEAVEHSMRFDWREAVPSNRIAKARLLQAGALAVLWTGIVFAWQTRPGGAENATDKAQRLGQNFRVTVEPGDASIERGTDLLVLARFAGPLPADVQVVFRSASEPARRVSLAKSLNDPLFGGRVTAVSSDAAYHVEFDGEHSSNYHVTVFDYPDVRQIDAELVYPAYTGLSTRRIEDTRHISAVEGTTVTIIGQLNKPVARAWLADDTGRTLDWTLTTGEPMECRVAIVLNATQRYTLHLIDADGRANKLPPEITLTAVPDRPPELVLKAPARDVRASPLEEIWLEAQAWDDFGILSYGLTMIHDAREPRSVGIGQDVPAKEQRPIEYTLYLEDERAKPDELFSYYFWAEDAAPGGERRRTYSDMFFVEVRPFEEIYRQGQQPTESEMRQQLSGQGGAAQQAEQLAELEKQIISATWKLIRQREMKPAELARDAGVVRDSQKTAREQLQQILEQAATPDAAEMIAGIEQHMTAALDQLASAADQSSAEPLQGALSSEQAAYRALLQLRAREHQVVRARQMAQSGGSGGNRADRQLHELELDSQQNRYESRRTPTSAQKQAANEDNQVLNRLRELARRQDDLNKRMHELQSALQAARDEEQRQELQRQLERLRDEQQDLLRDLDEVRDRMERPENQRRMADTREQLEQTRENMRQASESLRQDRLAPALNSGTRAQRELEQARDEFRRRTANQFADDMRGMRDDARELASRERDLSDRLEQMNNDARQALRDQERSKVIEQVDEQRTRLRELTDEIKAVSEAAEPSEPLLSKQLYDTYRDATQRNVDRSMELTSQLLRRGFVSEAGKAEQNVRQGVDRVRAGVERAARSVLGDPAEATRRAIEEVDELSRQLQQEITRADPDAQRNINGNNSEPGSSAQQRPSENETPDSDRQIAQSGSRPASKSGGAAPGGPQSPQQTTPAPQAGTPQSGSADAQNARSPSSSPSDAASGGQRRRTASRTGQQRARAGSGPEDDVDITSWTGPGGPITGDEFREWSDRLRDVEEMLENPDLRAEVAEINDRARDVRRDFKRHSQAPNWSSVRLMIAEPLVELQTKLREELARQESIDPLVPIDRDPVPRRYEGLVREYYERLGSGK